MSKELAKTYDPKGIGVVCIRNGWIRIIFTLR